MLCAQALPGFIDPASRRRSKTSSGAFRSFVMSNSSLQGLALPREAPGTRAFRHQSASSSSAGGWLHTLGFWIGRSRQRRQLGELAELNNYLLRDIGLSQEEALREAAKPFWH
jgi:uncharacterized protein YjiS (DUF1127 family)